MTNYIQTLPLKLFSDKNGYIKVEHKVGEPFVLYDAVVVLVPRKQYESAEARQKEWHDFVESTAGSCPDFPDPRENECPKCGGVGYLYPKETANKDEQPK